MSLPYTTSCRIPAAGADQPLSAPRWLRPTTALDRKTTARGGLDECGPQVVLRRIDRDDLSLLASDENTGQVIAQATSEWHETRPKGAVPKRKCGRSRPELIESTAGPGEESTGVLAFSAHDPHLRPPRAFLVLRDQRDLLSRQRRRFELVGQPLVDEPPRQLWTDHPGAEGEHLAVVG